MNGRIKLQKWSLLHNQDIWHPTWNFSKRNTNISQIHENMLFQVCVLSLKSKSNTTPFQPYCTKIMELCGQDYKDLIFYRGFKVNL